MQANQVNILFRFYSDVLDAETTEILQAEVVNAAYNYYRLSSIPFYASKIAVGDLVWAEFKDDYSMLVYRTTVERSGNSTIQVIVTKNKIDINKLEKTFNALGGITQKLNGKHFAMSVPAETDYAPIKRKLYELQKEQLIDYAESFISDKHHYKTSLYQ